MKSSIQVRLILALLLFVLVVGIASSVLEIASITRVELDSTYRNADFAARVVTSQLTVALANARGDLNEAIRQDRRLGLVLKDAEQITPAVTYVAITDTLGRVVVHSDSMKYGEVLTTQPSMKPREDLVGILEQAAAILREPGAYEVSLPLLSDGRDFVSVRVGLEASILRDELQGIVESHIWRLFLQLFLAVLLGVTVSWLLIHKPVTELQEGIIQARRGTGYRIPENPQNELGGLAVQINALIENVATERDALLVQHENLVNEGDALRQVVDAMDDGVLMLDEETRVMMANRPACRLLETSFASLSGRRLKEALKPGHPLAQIVRRAFNQNRRSESAQIEFPGEGGGSRIFLTTCQIVGDSPNREGAIVTLRDYGRMQRLQELIDHARVLSRLGKMAAGVAHEVRNPLNAMNIHLELLKEDLSRTGTAKENERLDTVRREITRLERVVYGFLKVTRLQELSLTRIKLEPLIQELGTLVRPEARMAGVEIEIDVASNVPDVYGDEEVLRQALLNLLRNAIQASRPGSLPVKVSAYPDGSIVRLLIKDHGQGIPSDVQPKVFDLYFTTKKDGTGVGLALVQQAVEMHGGTIGVQSEPDQGALFTISLPALASA